MKLLKSIALTCMICVLSISLFACGGVSSQKVYDDYETLARENPKMFTESKLMVQIDADVKNAILALNESAETFEGKELFTDLVNVYEPVLEISMDFYNNNKLFLEEYDEEIAEEDSTRLRELLDNLASSITDVANAVSSLEYYKNLFQDSDFVQSGIIKNKFEVLYIEYDSLINDAFAFNNQFIQMYTKKYPLIDYRDQNIDLTSADIKAVYNYTTAQILDVAFLLKDEAGYENALTRILTAVDTYQNNSGEENFLSVTTKSYDTQTGSEVTITNQKYIDMMNYLAILQTNLDTYFVQKDNFFTALDRLNGELTQADRNAYQTIKDEFVENSFVSVLEYFERIVNLLKID